MDTVPWKKVNIIKQEKLEWEDSFFCLSSRTHILTQIEESINVLKKKIENEFNDAYDWDTWKKLGNPYEFIYTPVKDKYPLPSLSIQNPLSRSYFKLWEICHVFDITFPQRITTSHVCEGPGGFIQCIYDWAEKNKSHIVDTHAMTLRPDHPSIPGWKRAINFLKKNKTINIEYGPNKDGNILNSENQEYLIQKSKNSYIFTADGGFDFSEEYDKQELNMFPLILNSIIICLQVLSINGICVIKIFDMHSQMTKDMIALFASCFKRWTIYKPATSRPCNSERYFIGLEYRGKHEKIINLLKTVRDTYNENMISFVSEEYTRTFFENFETLNNIILERQKESIEYILDSVKKYTFDEYYIEALKKRHYSEEWCKTFKIPFKL